LPGKTHFRVSVILLFEFRRKLAIDSQWIPGSKFHRDVQAIVDSLDNLVLGMIMAFKPPLENITDSPALNVVLLASFDQFAEVTSTHGPGSDNAEIDTIVCPKTPAGTKPPSVMATPENVLLCRNFRRDTRKVDINYGPLANLQEDRTSSNNPQIIQ
jgi:hypothetical protein